MYFDTILALHLVSHIALYSLVYLWLKVVSHFASLQNYNSVVNKWQWTK